MTETTARRIRVLLVDDDALVRAGLTMMLDGAHGIEVVGEAADGGEVPAAVDAHAPDVVLMDLRMPGVDGVEATRQIRAAQPDDDVLATIRNGCGNDQVSPVAGAGGGYGLRGMRERAQALGGTLTAGEADDAWQVSLRLPGPGAGTVTS